VKNWFTVYCPRIRMGCVSGNEIPDCGDTASLDVACRERTNLSSALYPSHPVSRCSLSIVGMVRQHAACALTNRGTYSCVQITWRFARNTSVSTGGVPPRPVQRFRNQALGAADGGFLCHRTSRGVAWYRASVVQRSRLSVAQNGCRTLLVPSP